MAGRAAGLANVTMETIRISRIVSHLNDVKGTPKSLGGLGEV